MIQAFKQRLTRIPSLRDWGEAVGLLLVFAAFSGVIALIFGPGAVLSTRDLNIPIWMFLPVSFVVPSMLEEAVFRGVLQPAKGTGLRSVMLAALSFCLFIVWHPVQVWFGLPMAQDLFLSPVFLALVAGLGLCTTLSVHRSGSLWTAIFIHWSVVVAWKLLSGV